MNPNIYQDKHVPWAVFWNVMSDLFQPNLRINFDQKLAVSVGQMNGQGSNIDLGLTKEVPIHPGL